jgi:hypothetical protein
MIFELLFSFTIISAAVLLIARKFVQKSKWLTGIALVLVLSELSISLAAVFYFSQYSLLWANFPQPPDQSVVTEA